MFDDIDLEIASPGEAYSSTPSDAITLTDIHSDIQLLNLTLLFMFVVMFSLFLVRGWRV